MPNKPLSNAELDMLYTHLCNNVETLHRQSQAEGGLARVLFYAFTSFLAERGAEDIDVSTNWVDEHEGHDERTCSYRDSLLG
jgi:hypothetical protein